MPDSILFKPGAFDQEHKVSESVEKQWSKWNIQNGYTDNAAKVPEIPKGSTADEILKNETLPRRAVSPGLHSGLTVVLNVDEADYYCSGTESVGAKVSL